MDAEKKEQESWPVWVNCEKRIISFQEATGFDRLEFPTHKEMFDFAIEKSLSGFAIQ